jgi:hypothetical protein
VGTHRYALLVPTNGLPKRTVRVSDEEWDAFSEVCHQQGTNGAEVLRTYLRYHLWRGTKPPRPKREDLPE